VEASRKLEISRAPSPALLAGEADGMEGCLWHYAFGDHPDTAELFETPDPEQHHSLRDRRRRGAVK